MDGMKKLNEHLRQRPAQIRELRKEGKKVIAVTANGFMPVEMIYAAGAIPIVLGKGGDAEAVNEAIAYTPLFLDTYSRQQIAHWSLGHDPYYRMPDLFITAITDANSKVIADSFNYYAKFNVYRLGVPHDKRDVDKRYFKHSLMGAKKAIEECTGNAVDEALLKEKIELHNEIRGYLRKISFLRKGADPVFSSEFFSQIMHAGFYADDNVYLECLKEIYEELAAKRAAMPEGVYTKPRLMVVAATLAHGDTRLHDIIRNTNAEIVYENPAEGFLPYLFDVELTGGDIYDDLIEGYFCKPILQPWDHPWGDRFDILLAEAKEFNAQAIIWYQTLYRDGYDLQAWPYKRKFNAAGLPFIKIETNYAAAERGTIKTRIETAIELIESGQIYDDEA